jgi:hypothetical protein
MLGAKQLTLDGILVKQTDCHRPKYIVGILRNQESTVLLSRGEGGSEHLTSGSIDPDAEIDTWLGVDFQD